MCVAFLLYASHVAQVPNRPENGEDQVPMSTPLDLSARPHSPAQPSPAAPGYWSTASDWLAEDHVSVIPLYALEKGVMLYLFMPLFQEMKQENGPQT